MERSGTREQSLTQRQSRLREIPPVRHIPGSAALHPGYAAGQGGSHHTMRFAAASEAIVQARGERVNGVPQVSPEAHCGAGQKKVIAAKVIVVVFEVR